MAAVSDIPPQSNWVKVTESSFPWEQDALEFIRQQFPTHEPYRAWSNFEFIADDGSINEVDLLVLSPMGFFLIEVKSRPGRLSGDAGTWTWETEGKLRTTDNPLFLANLKAKRLRSLLQRQKACRNKDPLPYVEALIFCSDPDLRCELADTARFRVCLRDRAAEGDRRARPGIRAAIVGRNCPGVDPVPRGRHDRVAARLIAQALEQAGIRPSQRHRKVSDYLLDHVIDEGPGYQDWLATHVQLQDVKRRVRLYLVRPGASVEERATIERAARREFQLLESLEHPGVLRTHGFTEHELGPALIFEYDPGTVRLDHFLAQRHATLSVDTQMHLLRQIAEVIRFAHQKHVVHRALCPQSILVMSPDSAEPHVKVLNWQSGYRAAGGAASISREITPTAHADRLVDDASTAYLAPEALSADGLTGEYLDVFSLGAIAYHLFAGLPPASSGLELSNKLRETSGLQVSAVLNGAAESLQFLIQSSTHPDVGRRAESVSEFLSLLDEVEDELTTPEQSTADDPCSAQKGDLLPGGWGVVRRLGQGATAVALLVEQNGEEYVLKVANSPDHNDRLRGEAEVLRKLRHDHIVEWRSSLDIGDRAGFLMRPVLVDREKRRVETLGQRLRHEGRLQLEMLQRFGEDLLEAVDYLEEQGIPHRDIKPDNIAIGLSGRGDRLHVTLFDFSLSRTAPDNIHAGTRGYLDPLLPVRRPLRWDLHAERYAVAATLYEMASGTLPRWGDGVTDPSHLDVEASIDADLFDPSLRDSLAEFFERAFRRDPAKRFDNAEEMLRAWRGCFDAIGEPATFSDHEGEEALQLRLDGAGPDTPVIRLGLSMRASNALDRANVLSVKDLLAVPMRRLVKLRGVGNQTRREILDVLRLLRARIDVSATAIAHTSHAPEESAAGPGSPVADAGTAGGGLTQVLSVDLLVERVMAAGSRDGEPARRALAVLISLESHPGDCWPDLAELAAQLQLSRQEAAGISGSLAQRWLKDPALTQLRSDVAIYLDGAGGVMAPSELAEALLLARGSVAGEPQRTRWALAVIRAAIEAEWALAGPRFGIFREAARILVSQDAGYATYAVRLGDLADELAAEDPLPPPARAVQRLRSVEPPEGMPPLSDPRLLHLSIAASDHAALSSRQELYPAGMDAGRALKLSQGALFVRNLTVAQIQERVRSRYHRAAPLPGRPALDELLRDAGLDMEWDSDRSGGCYVSRPLEAALLSAGSESLSRRGTSHTSGLAQEWSPEVADARQFEERLRRSLREGAFLALLARPRDYEIAGQELARRFPVRMVDLEGLMLDALRRAADEARVNWDLVLRADAAPGAGDWRKLLLLAGRALPYVEQQLQSGDQTLLLVYPGLLSRYDRMDLLEHLRDWIGRADGIPGLWLLIPDAGQGLATLDGKAVPILSPGQRAPIPDAWLQNRHRADSGSPGLRAGR